MSTRRTFIRGLAGLFAGAVTATVAGQPCAAVAAPAVTSGTVTVRPERYVALGGGTGLTVYLSGTTRTATLTWTLTTVNGVRVFSLDDGVHMLRVADVANPGGAATQPGLCPLGSTTAYDTTGAFGCLGVFKAAS